VLRGTSIALVTVLIAQSLWSTARLIDELIVGGPHTDKAGPLLAAASVVWISNNLAFGAPVLGSRQRRRGGEGSRAARASRPRVSATVEPAPRAHNWRPRFIDYLYLAFTNATAFSPTDVMPLVPWAKITMTVQAVISLSILGLVVARAVNVLT
jgi:hypothetical protein